MYVYVCVCMVYVFGFIALYRTAFSAFYALLSSHITNKEDDDGGGGGGDVVVCRNSTTTGGSAVSYRRPPTSASYPVLPSSRPGDFSRSNSLNRRPQSYTQGSARSIALELS